MQKPKETVRKKIIAVARREFLEKGFRGTSMRIVAEKSGAGLSNIYNYFKNKDEILQAVLAPLLKKLDALFDTHYQPEYYSKAFFESAAMLEVQMAIILDLIEGYRDDLKLLLFNTAGSSLEQYRDEFTGRYTRTSFDYLKKMKEKYPQVNTGISEFFIHNAGSWWLSTVGELITHDELGRKEIKKFISDYMIFATAGWKKIMGL